MCFDGAGTPGSSTSNIYNNTFYNIANVVSTYGEIVNFKNNIVYQCTGQVFVNPQFVTSDYNCFYLSGNLGTTSPGSHSLTSDPLFNNISNLDFKLKSGSPCIKKGISLLGAYLDIDGNNVPNASPDMGAHEFGVTASSSNKAPSVKITSPTNGKNFNAPATLSITVSTADADGSITKVQYYNGTVKLGESVAAPYTLSLKNVAVGAYNITAVAIDNLNAQATSNVVSIWVNKTATDLPSDDPEEFKIYPNPNDGRFSISIPNIQDDNASVIIYDLLGKPIYTTNLKQTSTESFDLSYLNSGTYILTLSYNHQKLYKKFVKY